MNNARNSPPIHEARRMLVRRVAQLLVMYGVIGAVLLLSAGRLDWPEAWAFLLVYFAVAAAGQAWLMKVDPGLVQERSHRGANTKTWDKWIVSANSVLLLALLIVIGLDAGRYGWSHVPWIVRGFALLGFVPAFGLPLWASRANTYLASTVRIQEERGHKVVATGPYTFVRHPMYAGMVLFDICLPLLLGSWCGLGVSAIMIALMIVRTALEDRTLLAELPGYREYAGRVRFRAIPGIW